MNIANFVLQSPQPGTDISRWFQSVVQKTDYCFFKFNDKVYGVSEDRGAYVKIDFPHELKQQLRK